MKLKEIYQPIQRELTDLEDVLRSASRSTKHKSILEINDYLLQAGGKRLRPALVILSAKTCLNGKKPKNYDKLINIAAAMELIHTASLVHDDVIDHSTLRRNRPTINSKRGEDVAIVLGDYLYSVAFQLISTCNNMDILSCISSAVKAMCEGELLQVCERDNLNLLKERYFLIVKNKTAALFVSSCQSGGLMFEPNEISQNALKEYGLNFGIAFQIVDDCMDLIAEKENLGKSPGSDFRLGELTLPILNLLSESKDKNRIMSLMKNEDNDKAFCEIRKKFIDSNALAKTKEDVSFYINKAKDALGALSGSCFKDSLLNLTSYVEKRIDS